MTSLMTSLIDFQIGPIHKDYKTVHHYFLAEIQMCLVPNFLQNLLRLLQKSAFLFDYIHQVELVLHDRLMMVLFDLLSRVFNLMLAKWHFSANEIADF